MATILTQAEQQIFLARLTEHHSIKRQPLFQSLEFSDLLAVREQRDAAFYTSRTFFENPVRNKIRIPIGFILGRDLEECLPWIASLVRFRERIQPISFRNILSDCVTLIAMNPALPLFQINRIRRQIPMHYRMAPCMKIQPFLAY